ncbi:MAG: winged helix-turn-helix transcriptional regulator, partial [Bacteroidota bacterium]|nr:winged helix-turn-helix transcriptional regulator [Bacteroidota bacterium]
SEKTTQKTIEQTRVKIIELINQNNKITRQELAERLNLTVKGVDWNINLLKEEGKLKRIGPDKGGHWKVVES